jgi:asparagine synthase (glutamine-hydrolysing)
MCGIVGVVARGAVEEPIVERMRDRLVHRGPDAAGLWSSADRRVCLGHRRLSIVDLSPDANQPFLSSDGRYAITLNGEIYNFRALQAQLRAEGVSFRTRSDTEVLVEAYRRWGAGCLGRLSGMFAFAIWDSERRTLFCARDRAGEKPFYYTVAGGAFVFASELKSLLLWPGFRRELDHTALADYLTFGFVPDPKSIWEGTHKLPPGHSLTVELGRDDLRVAEPVQWWDLALDPDGERGDWQDAILDTLSSAAGEMSFADVPVGTFLSGGIDSSSVTAALRRLELPVRTFTIGFEEDGFDERPFAREVATLYKTDHTERTVIAGDVASLFRDTILWHYDEPFNDYSYLPTYALCREARRSITVALSGDGGDELFAGYRKYTRAARRQGIERALPGPVTQLVASGAHAVLPWRDRLSPYRQSGGDMLASTFVNAHSVQALRSAARGDLARTLEDYDPMDTVTAHLAKAPPAEVGLVNAMRYLDLKLTLAGGILVKVDRASMAVALEVRPVYLHRDVLALAGRIPPALLADRREPKKALRSALREWLPSSILDRPKQGFAMPLGRWLHGDLQGLAADGNGALGELLDPGYVRGTARAHLSGERDETSKLHSLLFLDHWLERWQ